MSSTAGELEQAARDDAMLFGPAAMAALNNSTTSATAAIINEAVKFAPPAALKRRIGLLRRETLDLADSDRRTLSLCLRIAALADLVSAAEVRQHLHEALTLGFAQPTFQARLDLIAWFVTDSRDRAAKRQDMLTILQTLQDNVAPLKTAEALGRALRPMNWEEQSTGNVPGDSIMSVLRQLTRSLQGQTGAVGLRAAGEYVAIVDPAQPVQSLARALSVDHSDTTIVEDSRSMRSIADWMAFVRNQPRSTAQEVTAA
jgi:hypothetical protein